MIIYRIKTEKCLVNQFGWTNYR